MSKTSYSTYPLFKGYIHNWLVAGPQAISVDSPECFGDEDLHLNIARHHYETTSGITQQPVEPGVLTDGQFTLVDTEFPYEGAWRYERCHDDHFVDLSTFHHTCHYLRSWAYTEIESPTEAEVTLILTTNGPADVWLNDAHIHRQEHHHLNHPHSVASTVHFSEGYNRILVRFENTAILDCTYVMAMQIAGNIVCSSQCAVLVPTTIAPIEYRNKLEAIFDAAYIEQDYFTRDEDIIVKWPSDLGDEAEISMRLQTPEGRIYAQADDMGVAGKEVNLGHAYQLPNSALNIVLMPRFGRYYREHVRITHKLRTWGLGNNHYHEAPYGTFDERRKQALLNAARLEIDIFSEIAKVAIGWWSRLEMDTLMTTIEAISQGRDCSDSYLMGLLGMIYRFGDDPKFPQELKQPLEHCILNFRYWYDEPGSDTMCYRSENHQILFHACEILAGQLYPDRIFANNGQTGKWHQEHGEHLALAWMRDRGTKGFSEWDSDCSFEEDLLALSHIADLAGTGTVWEMASILIDKILFAIALNSYKGVFGSTHGRTSAQLTKGGYLAGTMGITNLMWGMGMFNERILGTVSMACMKNYELPVMLQHIAADLPEEMWNREHHAPGDPFRETDDGVDKVTYKTPDYMLCSAQDYRPGKEGCQQHIWQATLGPGATVFVNHPSCASEDSSRCSNFWIGNFVMPRVAQWRDTLIAVHKLPENDWMGFTHAYFPVHAFDDYDIKRDAQGRVWAFAQKGDGYLALVASSNFALLTSGPTAYRELRVHGLKTVWLCQMGRAALDGDFAAFQGKVLALDVTFDDLSVRASTLRGDVLGFGWEGQFQRNGESVPLHNFKHYDSSYCVADFPCEQMDIRFGDVAMRLQFAAELSAQ